MENVYYRMECEDMEWIQVAQDWLQRWALENIYMNLQVL
jgi:hypothetical protein